MPLSQKSKRPTKVLRSNTIQIAIEPKARLSKRRLQGNSNKLQRPMAVYQTLKRKSFMTLGK